MQPEISKQEQSPIGANIQGSPPREEILQNLAKAYEQDIPVDNVEAAANEAPNLASPDLSIVGSVGVEAGLNNFEIKSADDSSSDDNDDASEDERDEDSIPKLKPVGLESAASVIPVVQPAMTAEDKDEIEIEWVTKAKKIVEQTKSDPHLQERAVSRLQADYLKKRFNKDIKLPKEGSSES